MCHNALVAKASPEHGSIRLSRNAKIALYSLCHFSARCDMPTGFGAYDLSRGMTVSRSAEAKVWLPSENEWYKAAYFQPEERGGPKGSYWKFPFCTHDQPVKADPGSEQNHAACFSRGFDGIVPVGSYPNAKSPSGALDMGGNVWEWTDTTVFQSKRVLRGGSAPHNLEKMRSNVRSNASPDRWYPDTGFRLARRIEN
jgi:formylglycine-generating enzyme required for sulfatase activity